MAKEPDNLTLKILRRLDEKTDRLLDDMHDVKIRMTAVEEALAGVHHRMDRIDEPLERVERRLDLAEA